jgi:hypothetical protein
MEEEDAQGGEQHVEHTEREVVAEVRHPAEIEEEVRKAEAGSAPERIVVTPGQADVVDHDVAVERPNVEQGHGEDHG